MIIFLFHFADKIENASKGNPKPIPKAKKLIMLDVKLLNNNALAKKAAINAGLHGITIAPKKNPKIKALSSGFFAVFTFAFGKNLEKSRLNIKNKLIIPSIANAIGETMPMTFVNDSCKRVVNIKPRRVINITTPKTTIKPNKI